MAGPRMRKFRRVAAKAPAPKVGRGAGYMHVPHRNLERAKAVQSENVLAPKSAPL